MSKSARKILQTAEQLFYQNGIHAVGVDLIRDESGCSKTTMYTYFKNKNQLVNEVLKFRDVQFRVSLENFLADAVGLDAIDKIWDWHILWFQQDEFQGCLFVRAVAESGDHEVLEISQSHKKWLFDLITRHCEQLDDHLIISEMIYTMIEGAISRFLVEGFEATHVNKLKKALNKILYRLA